MHDRAVAGSRWTAVARLRRRHAQHRRLPRPPRRRGRLCDGAGRRPLERGDAGGLARRGCRHRPRRARAGQAAGALSHRHRRRRPAPLLLLARQRAGAAAVRPAADARDRGRSRPLRPRLPVGGHPVALRRVRARPAARRPRHGPRPRRPHRLRHQLSHPRLAGPRDRQGRLPRGARARRHRAGLHGGPRAAVWRERRGRAAHPRSSGRGRAQAGAAGGSHLPGRRRRDRCRRARAQRRRHHGCRRQLRRRLLAARLAGARPAEAARSGHRLAGAVVRHRGAVIPRSAMPAAILPSLEVRP